jgi:hypothetical protein
MGKKQHTATYVYWSQRAVDQFIQDNGGESKARNYSIKIPSIAGLSPEVGWDSAEVAQTRSATARSIERILSPAVIRDLCVGRSGQFFQGEGSVIFGEFALPNGTPEGSLMFAKSRASDGTRAVICMFGSLDNFVGRVANTQPVHRRGWTSSCATSVRDFLDARCEFDIQGFESRSNLAFYAYQIAAGQGSSIGGRYPWDRGFTYGDIRKSGEWMMEIYFDLHRNDAIESPNDSYLFRHDAYDRILIGRPLWVRSSSRSSVRIYEDFSADQRALWPAVPILPELGVRAVARKWFRRIR